MQLHRDILALLYVLSAVSIAWTEEVRRNEFERRKRWQLSDFDTLILPGDFECIYLGDRLDWKLLLMGLKEAEWGEERKYEYASLCMPWKPTRPHI